MYKVKPYNKLTTKEFEKFWATIEEEYSKDSSPAMVNMFSQYWRTEKNTLRYILEVEKKFNPGEYYILFDGRLPVASGGVYLSEWANNIAMAGIRTWVHTEHRNKFLAAEYILPACKTWALKNNCNAITLTFNDYNRRLINTWKRTRMGESSLRIKNRTSEKMFYNGIFDVDFPMEINYTKQWLIYEKLNSDFNFNWEEFKWRDKIKIVHRKLG